jgi:hypothetical protein
MADKLEESKRELRKFGDEEIKVIFRKLSPPEELSKFFPPLAPSVQVEDGILVERDVAVRMRDGTIIYADIYRPEGAKNLPAIVAWSPYGKNAGWPGQDHKFGIPISTIVMPESVASPMCKFEGPDPAYWCHHGYAVINPDSRGSGNSESDIAFWGAVEARDCYDLIEWLATQSWSNGKVTMQGNSWLAVIQWFAAAERPPHLTCIAPWSGFADAYRYFARRGGIPETGFTNWIVATERGHGSIEDITAMAQEYPLMNGYWEDKIAKVENIEIPVYTVGNYNLFHNSVMDIFRRLPSQKKWLRIENTMEWPDNYEPQNLDDLRRFYDRYLKGIRNGWEFTPRVRLSVYDPGGVDVVNRPEQEWPLARAQHQELFLDAASGTLSRKPATKESTARYKADGKGEATFTIRFDVDTELVGYWKLRLWVEVEGADDMDLFVGIQKLNQQGELLSIPFYGQPHSGIAGLLRVSHRELDKERSTASEPYLKHRRQQRLKPKEIVPVEIPLWPLGMFWHAGQQLRIVVSDHSKGAGMGGFSHDLINRGEHIIHTGGKYDSHLLVPVIPR